MKSIEFFCGTKSFSKVASKYGIEMLTSDIDKQFNPDVCGNILNIELNIFKSFNPDIIWASPPCECFSVAAIGSNWTRLEGKNYIPKRKETEIAISLVDKTLELIDLLKPKYWFIENPRGVLRKIINPIINKYNIKDYVRKTVTYCQYGDKRMKPTDIWTNCYDWIPRPMCKNGDPCHEKAPRGSKTGTQGLKGRIERSIVPKELCEEIIVGILNDYKSTNN